MIILYNLWWFLVVSGGSLRFLVVLGGSYWVLVALGGSCWWLVVLVVFSGS